MRNRSVLQLHPLSQYRFLPGIEPYSCGVVAEPGWRMERVSLPEWLPWREGFEFVDAFLARRGLARQALCAMELRSPAPFPMNGFIEFNRGYCDLLKAWGLLVSGQNPVARTNVYTVHPLLESLRDRLRARLGASSRWGITWNVTRPPVIDIEFEMDLHGLAPDASS